MHKFAIQIPLVASLLAFSLAGTPLHAQTAGGVDVLSGRVTDLTGKPIADAQVIAFATAPGVTRTTTTDQDGRYSIYFPGAASQYQLQVKRMGFAPVQRTVARRTKSAEHMTIDVQLGGTPLALSMVEISGSTERQPLREVKKLPASDVSVPNPITEILALKDTLHLSAVQIVGLGAISDTLQVRNETIYRNIRTLLAKSAEAGDATQMAGSVAIMLEEASGNTSRAVVAARGLLSPDQWAILPQTIRDRSDTETSSTKR